MSIDSEKLINEMIAMNEQAKSDNYTVLTVSMDKFASVMADKSYDADSYYNFLDKEYGIKKSFIKSEDDGDNIKFYIKRSKLNSIKYDKFVSDMEASINEYYGVVQLDGDEPAARGNYNTNFDDDTLGIMTSPTKDGHSKQVTNNKMHKKESTDAGNIPTKAGATTIPTIKKRKKIIGN